MVHSYTPHQILSTLLPYLKTAGDYALKIQAQIGQQPDKADMPNFFASALSDADLSVQTFIEVALLAHFPDLHFFGEEHEKSYNTAYFPSIDLGGDDDWLITLDPIDGTRFYLDNFPNFQIILTLLSPRGYEAAIALSPAKREYFYAIQGEGTYRGTWDQSLDACHPLNLQSPSSRLLLGFAMQSWAESMQNDFDLVCIAQDYSAERLVPNVNGILSGELAGAVLAKGNWIDGGAIAFLVQEAGGVVTDLSGQPLPELIDCQDRRYEGLIIATNAQIHAKIQSKAPTGSIDANNA